MWMLDRIKDQPPTAAQLRKFTTSLKDVPDFVIEYNATHPWEVVLSEDGWTLKRTDSNDVGHWVRPHKNPREGSSATTYYAGLNMLYVYSTSHKFLEAGRGYSPWQYMVFRDYGKDDAAFKLAGRRFHEASMLAILPGDDTLSASSALSAVPTTQEGDESLSAVPLCPHDAWPILPEAALYGLAGEVVRTIQPETEADPAALLLTFLTMYGAAVGRGPHAMADGAEHPARLFTVIVGKSAKARKGTSEKQIRRVFERADSRFTEERILNGFGSGEALVDAVDASLPGADTRLLVQEAEWARILSVCSRDGATLSPLLRQAWDGDILSVRSRGKGVVKAAGAHVCVLAHITVNELHAKLNDVDVANGYANRHLFGLARRAERLLPTGGHLDDAVLTNLGKKTTTALSRARKVGLMQRTPEAEALWARLYSEMADDDSDGLLGSITARDSAQVLRLSVVYALCDGSSLIGVSHVEAAWAVWSYCRASAAYIFGDSLGNPEADKLLAALHDAGPEGLSGRDIDRVFGGHLRKPAQDAVIATLVKRGLAATYTKDTGGRPLAILVAIAYADKAELRTKSTTTTTKEAH
jgi:Protein of unknown function (DUF3987)